MSLCFVHTAQLLHLPVKAEVERFCAQGKAPRR